jgi:hypothetical protein
VKVESAMALPFSLPMPYRFDLKSALNLVEVWITYFNPHFCLFMLGTTLSVEVPSGESVN